MNDKSYMDWVAMSDRAISQRIGHFVRHHRLNQNKTQKQVAEAAHISRSTLSLLEKGETVTVASLIQVLRILDLLHVFDAFQVKEQISPIQLAKLEQKKRKRARNKELGDKPKSDW